MKLDYDAIKRDNPIEDIIGQTVKLTKIGAEYKACCPFHGEKTPSFYVIPKKQMFHCFGCGETGDVLDFIAKTQGCSATQAIEYLTGGNPLKLDPAKEDERKAAIAAREAQQRTEQSAAIAKAAAKWEAAKPASDIHPYLARKQASPHTARQDDAGNLLLPIYGPDGALQSVQAIAPDGGKRFHPGAPTKNGRMAIGINMGRSIICEGFATGDAIYEALPDQVIIAFSKANIANIAREFAEAKRSFFIAADNNALAEMELLGKELSCPVIAPPEYDDFNDLRVAKGVQAVADAIETGLRGHADKLLEDQRIASTHPETSSGPMDLWRAPVPPKLPRGILPDVIERFAFGRSEQLGTDPSGLAMAALACCAAAIRDPICIKPKRHENWTENARLWVMLVGVPSTKKSPILTAATKRIKAIDNELSYEGSRALQEYLEDGGKPNDANAPKRPSLRIGDTTMEAAQEACRHSPDGIIAIQDELSGWFGSIEKYGSGKGASADRSFWLQSFGGGSYKVDRIGRGRFMIDNLSVSILGGIQPDAIRRTMVDSTDDGLIQRFLPVILGPADVDKDIPIPPVAEEYDALIDALRELKAGVTVLTNNVPCFFDDEGQKIREAVRDHNDRMIKTLEPINAKLSSHIGKFDGIFPRLCLVWHCIEHASTRNQSGYNNTLPATISVDTVKRVQAFLEGFIIKHSGSFYNDTLGLSDNQDTVRAVAGHILANKLETVTMRTLERAVRRLRTIKHKDDRERVMEHLEAFGWLEKDIRQSGAPIWKVAPGVHELYDARAHEERERRLQLTGVVRELES